ncbi:2-phospho-L-lactate guanylyltransferase [Streptomyces sp. NPDC059916]|uniref:2-phospho-L-lactate guanylyltransferase n=1 Tax=Streptomyces sp. NPDC059916 TaxID=3347001 RepID=UPI0036A69489
MISDGEPSWHAVVSIKSLDQAMGMAEDVIAALVRARVVAGVVVVCDDPPICRMARSYGADVLRDPGGGLNAAFCQGTRLRARADCRVCLVMADLPCLTAELVDTVLADAARHRKAVVPDLAGTGTTMLTSAAGTVTSPRFGPGSFRRHVASGAQPIALDVPQVRCDVDTPEDLRVALRLEISRNTAAAVAMTTTW